MLTIVFATHNGAHTLPRMLEALCNLCVPDGGWQIIGVVNACTDDSERILRGFSEHLPLSILNQPKRGKNRALNLAIPEVRGDLVVFTDDDVIPDPDWLVVYQTCAANHPDCDLFGGSILPHWSEPPSDWILQAVPHGVTFALTEPTLPAGPIFPGLIWGPNMMVRRRVLDADHRFNEDVGPSSGQYMMGSETEFNLRMAANGYKTWFCPEARVCHIIREFQMRPEWVVNRAFRYGRNMCFQEYAAKGLLSAESWLFGRINFPRWMARRVIEDTVLGQWARMRGDRVEAVRRLWDSACYRGYMVQAQTLRRQYMTCASATTGAAA